MSSFVSSLMAYGYWGLFLLMTLEYIGLPIPGETTLTVTGTLIAAGKMCLLPAVLSVTVGSVFGSAIAYAVGRYLGRHFVMKYGRPLGITPARMVKAERWFDRYKILMLLFGRYIIGVRHAVPYMAGIGRITWFDFILYTTIGSIIWALTFISLGHTLMIHIDPILAALTGYWYIWTAVVLVIGTWTWLWWRRRERSRSPADPTDTPPSA
ncbi:MAG: DedA family protein [Kyrpidia sp.]|nr:DedA family protein [Kyrpidia sp.]